MVKIVIAIVKLARRGEEEDMDLKLVYDRESPSDSIKYTRPLCKFSGSPLLDPGLI